MGGETRETEAGVCVLCCTWLVGPGAGRCVKPRAGAHQEWIYLPQPRSCDPGGTEVPEGQVLGLWDLGLGREQMIWDILAETDTRARAGWRKRL